MDLNNPVHRLVPEFFFFSPCCFLILIGPYQKVLLAVSTLV